MSSPSNSRPTMKSVAALAGVGLKTVSRVINKEPYVSDEVRARVEEAIAQLDYRTHEQASSLRRASGRTNTLGLLVGNVANPFSGAIHRAVEDVAKSHHTAVFASSLDDDPDSERDAIEAFLRRRVDALILTVVADDQSYLGREVERRTPMVFVDRHPQGIIADVVASDNEAGAASAVDHLRSFGHASIAFLGDEERIETARLRRRGYLDALARAGMVPRGEHVVTGLTSADAAYVATRSMLEGGEPPTAIFSAQNQVSVGVVRALKDAGASSSVALVGFDDLPLADLLSPPLTVVQQDVEGIGRVAAERVFKRLSGSPVESEEITLPTRLVPRGSGEIARSDG